MQGRFCKNYKLIRGSFQNGKKKDFVTDSNGTLFDDEPSIGSLPAQKQVANLGGDFDTSKIHFRKEDIESILDVIKRLDPSLNEKVLYQIKRGLEWTFKPEITVNKSESDLLHVFYKVLLNGKNKKISRSGEDMNWKNDLYKTLDIDKIVQTLKAMIEK